MFQGTRRTQETGGHVLLACLRRQANAAELDAPTPPATATAAADNTDLTPGVVAVEERVASTSTLVTPLNSDRTLVCEGWIVSHHLGHSVGVRSEVAGLVLTVELIDPIQLPAFISSFFFIFVVLG